MVVGAAGVQGGSAIYEAFSRVVDLLQLGHLECITANSARDEVHEAAGFKNDGWIHIEKYLT